MAPDADLARPMFWTRPAPHRLEAFRRLRELPAPVYFPEPGGGFHALVRHPHVVTASRTPAVFTSGAGVTTPRPPQWVRRVFGDSMVNLDDPAHARLRGVVARAFTPRVLARIDADVTRIAARIADDLAAAGPGDFVPAAAGRMPFEVICSMMGIPERDRPRILAQIDHSTERTRRWLPGQNLRAMARMHHIVGRVARQRRAAPADDLISALAVAEPRLGVRELGSFFQLLLVAGVETTRNAIAHGLHLLTMYPDQRALLVGDFDAHADGFVDEVVRFASPIIQFRRTVAADYELDGHPLRAGDDVVLFYGSANRDAAVFTDPDVFDITRRPNPHVGFGGGGPHFCLGTALARQEMRALFRELLTRMPGLRCSADPTVAPSSFDNRIVRLPYTY